MCGIWFTLHPYPLKIIFRYNPTLIEVEIIYHTFPENFKKFEHTVLQIFTLLWKYHNFSNWPYPLVVLIFGFFFMSLCAQYIISVKSKVFWVFSRKFMVLEILKRLIRESLCSRNISHSFIRESLCPKFSSFLMIVLSLKQTKKNNILTLGIFILCKTSTLSLMIWRGRVGGRKKKGRFWVFRRFHWWINIHKKIYNICYLFPLAKVYTRKIFYIPSFAKVYALRIALFFFIRESKIQKFREFFTSRKFVLLK